MTLTLTDFYWAAMVKHMTFCSVSEQHVVGYFLAGVTQVQME